MISKRGKGRSDVHVVPTTQYATAPSRTVLPLIELQFGRTQKMKADRPLLNLHQPRRTSALLQNVNQPWQCRLPHASDGPGSRVILGFVRRVTVQENQPLA